MIGIAAAAYFGTKNYKRILPGPNRSSEAILAAQDAIRRSFEHGTAVRFMPRESTRVEPGASGFKIHGWLEAGTADGKISQVYDYNCIVKTSLIGDWSVTNLDLEAH